MDHRSESRRVPEKDTTWEVAKRRYLSEESMGLIDQPVPDELGGEGVSLAIMA